MSDFGLGDDFTNEEKLTKALRWHGLLEEQKEKEQAQVVPAPSWYLQQVRRKALERKWGITC